MRFFLLALAIPAALAAPVCAANQRFFEDAALRAVQFVDVNEGWAVGDEGVIWHSIDGGKNWERQPTGTRASLRGVCFLNSFTGWVAGREELPGGGSVGVVLTTRDGGLKWERVGANAIPGANCVRFFDDKFGVVAGDSTDQFPSGVFSTNDGGRTWKAIAGPRCPSWLASDFTDPQQGSLVGTWSRLATLRQGVLGAADVDTLGGRSLCGVAMWAKQAVAVGQGGVVLSSANSSGVRWGFTDLKLPTEVLANLDWQAVTFRHDDVWIAGRPGSVMLHSPDRGQTWEMRPTGQNAPLHGLYFLNEKQGWAVGELGTVLATTDGGKTWTPSHRGGQRAAVLFIHARPTGLPLDTVAVLGGEDGYLTAALQVTSPDPLSARPTRGSDCQRWNQAMRLADGAGAENLWQFPLPDHGKRLEKRELIAAWDRLHGDRGAEQMLRQLVLAIRMWQPDVLITDMPGDGERERAAEDLISEGVQEAFKRAADPTAFPEQIEKLGLKPWKVSKLYARCEDRGQAQVTVDLSEVRQRLQAPARDYASAATGLLAEGNNSAPTQTFYRLLASRIDGAAKHGDLMAGIGGDLAMGGTARRMLEEPVPLKPEEEKALRQQRTMLKLIEPQAKGIADPNQLLASIGPTLEKVPAEHAAPATFAIASQFARTGQWEMAREMYLLLVDRYPAHPLAAEAYRWLIRHNCSSEARRRNELGQFIMSTQSKAQTMPNPAEGQKGPIRTNVESVQERNLALFGDRAEVRKWYEGALEIEPRLAGFGPLFASDPSVHFCLQAAKRNLGKFDETKKWYTRFVTENPEGPWRDAAASELWLSNRSGTPPKPVAYCRQTGNRPFLDGNFDDDCWKGMQPIKLRNANGDTIKEYPTEAWLAYDKDFLYVALRCKHPEDKHVAPAKIRQRDADLRDFDRVSILLDVDRDYNTYYRLEVDQRGCLCEDCWGDKSWNPSWFVAIRSEPTSWQVEIAIPMVELVSDPVTIGKAWACNLVRVLPGRGVQGWSVPADVDPRPEGMGLLLFVPDGKSPKTMTEAAHPPTAN